MTPDRPAPEPPRVLVPFAEGTEDMELVILTDLLTRAGALVVRAAPTREPTLLQHGTRITPDASLHDVRDERFALVAIPGGWRGAVELDAEPNLAAILQRCRAEAIPVAAVCSAPNVLRRHGLIQGTTPFTAHPSSLGFGEGGLNHSHLAVVATADVITGRSAGHTVDWTLALVERLFGPERRQGVVTSLGLVER